MKYTIRTRYTSEPHCDAFITTDLNRTRGHKLGLAVLWAIENDVDIRGTDLSGAILRSMNLSGVDFSDCNLIDADISYASINGTVFEGACITNIKFEGVNGINDYFKCMQVGDWPIAYNSTHLQVGRQRHTFDEWCSFSYQDIAEMGVKATNFVTQHDQWLEDTIERFPAKPTGS